MAPRCARRHRSFIALNKPKGYLCSRGDTHERMTIYDLLPLKYQNLHHVGRLDKESEGLILLTNRGDLSHRIIHPSQGAEKEYEVVVDQPLNAEVMAKLVKGMMTEEGFARAERAWVDTGYRAHIVLKMGLKRQIRMMLYYLGYEVTASHAHPHRLAEAAWSGQRRLQRTHTDGGRALLQRRTRQAASRAQACGVRGKGNRRKSSGRSPANDVAPTSRAKPMRGKRSGPPAPWCFRRQAFPLQAQARFLQPAITLRRNGAGRKTTGALRSASSPSSSTGTSPWSAITVNSLRLEVVQVLALLVAVEQHAAQQLEEFHAAQAAEDDQIEQPIRV
jgi:pseudouridine synthase